MPTRSATLAIFSAVIAVGLSPGCTRPTTATPPSAASSSTTPVSGAMSTTSASQDPTSDHGLQAICDSQPWPLPVPALTGMILDQAEQGALFCFDNVRAHTASGDDPHNNPADLTAGNLYRITSTSPPPGTRIGPNDLLTVEVTQYNPTTEQPAFYPCDWITPEEVASILGTGSTPSTVTTGDEAGSVDRTCHYNTGDSLISSELKLDGTLFIDADTEYRWRVAKDGGAAITSLPVAAACDTTEGGDQGASHSLFAKLSGNRIYQLLGNPNTSCDQLTQLAAIAIPRIGP